MARTGPITNHVSPSGGKSAGVCRIEDLAAVLTTWDRVFVFLGVFLVAFAYGLDGTLRYAYQPLATASFSQHSLLATVNVLRSVIAAAAQPTAAKIADLFGRVELVCLSVVFYILGTIVEASSTGVSGFAAGALIYQVGYTMIMLLVEVIVADITSTRARVFFSYVPAMPFLVTTWVSGNVSQAVLAATTWRWGIGMWAIIYPVCALPLIVSLTVVGRRARKEQQQQQQTEEEPPRQPWIPFLTDLFWRLDVIGIVMLVAIFALLLVPLTLAGGFHASWSAPRVIIPLVVGACVIPSFFFCQLRARHPLVPLRLMTGRAVWCPLAIALLLNWAWYMQGDYLFSVLTVAFDFDTMTATRVASFYSFFGVLTGTLLGLVVYKVRRLKIFIIAGTCLFALAFGLLIHFRGSPGPSDRAGVIGAQILLGIAGGMFPYPAQASLQAGLKHEHLAVMTGLYLATYNLGSAVGGAVSGAIWTQVLPGQLDARLHNSTLAQAAYSNPFEFAAEYPVGTPERTALIESYKRAQMLLTITGICLCLPLVVCALLMADPRLNDRQTLVEEVQRGCLSRWMMLRRFQLLLVILRRCLSLWGTPRRFRMLLVLPRYAGN
ncbi:hypothetical protein C8A05DRAFT_44491 [Staphylotrichum tortipilum]|uniref:Uncharacterized protein n=1 Tax=Staphylotrichum tortipilum TaxID=2831512 RepID=A0AAN6MK43_9PEZI|nr:hypothetical protein C8A05DRAFT_44491 [Staphylotrichum longicolle]